MGLRPLPGPLTILATPRPLCHRRPLRLRRQLRVRVSSHSEQPPCRFGNVPRPATSGTDPDWEWETSERISEVCRVIAQSSLDAHLGLFLAGTQFATISLNSPDLLTHLQELSRRYPPEPVERAALRFFESVAEWRGTPELEAVRALSSHLIYQIEEEFG